MLAFLGLLNQIATNASFLILCAMGLIIILGMMNIINLAHGQLMMMGSYVATITYNAGMPFILSVAMSFFVVGLFGLLLERLVVRRFYGRELGALVITWGIGLILSQGALVVFGPFMPPIPVPLGAFKQGGLSFSYYRLALVFVSIALIVGLWWIYYRTKFGMVARATMQNPGMANSLGVNTKRVYMLTFSIGSGLAGFSGALLAPISSIAPYMGDQFIAPAFITVVIGGATNVIAGAAGSSIFLSLIQSPIAFFLGAFLGTVALLCAALVIIRILPNGISLYLQQMGGRFSIARKPVIRGGAS
jgi:branched-subunit amino acid ABC-type transport system permease component